MAADRYELQKLQDDDEYGICIWDKEIRDFVRTGRGNVYTAPLENAQWVADTLNRKPHAAWRAG